MTYFRPHFLPEGLPGACTISGVDLKWANCTPLSFAMGIDRATEGRVRLSGCAVRRETGDHVGGTTIEQNAAVAKAHGVSVTVRTGRNVISPTDGATALQAGRGIALAGNLSALIGTSHRSNGVGVNHNAFVNEVRGGVLGHPKEALVYDPAANGRRVSWGKAAQGPEWWSWDILLAYAAALEPAGEGTGRLGGGKWYAGLFPATANHTTTLWGPDVPADVRAVDPSGEKVVAAFTKVSHETPGGAFHYGSAIDLADIATAYKRLKWVYNAANPGALAKLLEWAAKRP